MSAGGESHGWVMEAVDVYELPLLRYARRILGDVDLAADTVQHAFVKLCEESQERLEGRVAPWLFRVCRNRALDHLRQSGRERSLLGEGDIAAPTEGQPASRETDPALAVERADLAARLRALLKDLPAPQRETIDLWCEGLTYRQIAEVTGRQEGHVRVLAHRGLTSLRMHPLIRDLLQTDGSPTAAQAPTS
ncbi:MAG: RNA polymerase sigma factor [Planctomycetia bacterium]